MTNRTAKDGRIIQVELSKDLHVSSRLALLNKVSKVYPKWLVCAYAKRSVDVKKTQANTWAWFIGRP